MNGDKTKKNTQIVNIQPNLDKIKQFKTGWNSLWISFPINFLSFSQDFSERLTYLVVEIRKLKKTCENKNV